LRKAAWRDKRPKQIEGPKTITQVHEQAHCEETGKAQKSGGPDSSGWEQVGGSSRSSAPRNIAGHFIPQGSSPVVPSMSAKKTLKQTTPKAVEPDIVEVKELKKATKSGALERLERAEREKKEAKDVEKAEKAERKAAKAAKAVVKAWDCDVYREEVQKTLAELRVSHDWAEGALRLADAVPPVSKQPSELCHLLALIMEEGSVDVRKAGFSMVSKLFLDKAWPAESINAGLQAFVEETCEDLRCDVPALPRILKEELHPEFAALVSGGMLEAERHEALLSEL